MARKAKGSKENCLFLNKKEKPSFRNGYLKSMETIPSTMTEIMPENNQFSENKFSFGNTPNFQLNGPD